MAKSAQRKTSLRHSFYREKIDINSLPPVVCIGCDTEYQVAETLSAQFATIVGSMLIVKIYLAPGLPLANYEKVLKRLVAAVGKAKNGKNLSVCLRPIGGLNADLSIARILADLLGDESLKSLPRTFGMAMNPDHRLKEIKVELIAHFWTADFFRIFGADFNRALLFPNAGRGLHVVDRKTLGFADAWNQFAGGTVLEHLRIGEQAYALRVNHFDTSLVYGKSSLADLADRLLGTTKSDAVTQEEKAAMRGVFEGKPNQACSYAAIDAALTLLVAREMDRLHRCLYRDLGFDIDIPRLGATVGRRVTDLMVTSAAYAELAKQALKKMGNKRQLREFRRLKRALKRLMKKGSAAYLERKRRSWFGQQTWKTHGGLCVNRSPAKFFHHAPGMLRDVDLSNCYASTLEGMRVYLGEPLVHEPGRDPKTRKGMTLREALAFVTEHAAGRDAWFIRVSGTINSAANGLIPSTLQALTHDNVEKQRSRAASKAAGNATAEAEEDGEKWTAMFWRFIESGVVAWPTAVVIKELPDDLRAEYLDLEVESIVFYARDFIAESLDEHAALVERLSFEGPSWHSRLLHNTWRRVTVERPTPDNAALAFDVGGTVAQLVRLRREAIEKYGRGCAMEKSLKLLANTHYGVLSSKHAAVHNVVAAQFITAVARAKAFVLAMSLNAIQTITDGCSYRADQVPDCTFAEGVHRDRWYPIKRSETLPFLPAASVPIDADEFNVWIPDHAKRFFEARSPEFDELLAMHRLEHKMVGKPARPTFDALLTFASADNVMLVEGEERLEVVDAKFRGVHRDVKPALCEWLLRVVKDGFELMPPLEAKTLLKFKEALAAAGASLRRLVGTDGIDPEVVFPLGLETWRQVRYAILKATGFTYEGPKQRRSWHRHFEKLRTACGCGYELLTLKRTTERRRQGSLEDAARQVLELILAGKKTPGNELNLDPSDIPKSVHLAEVRRHLRQERRVAQFDAVIEAAEADRGKLQTGLIVTAQDLMLMRQTA